MKYGRLIDGDALYKELNAIRKEEVLLHGRSNNKDCCTLSTALYEIEHAPTIEPEPKWIPCSERLPESRLDVLVTYKYEYGLVDCGIACYSEYEKKWYTSRKVIAWMPLPKPWRE